MLFASGWTLEEVLDLSWEQLATVVGCVLSYKAEQANLIMDAVSTSLGGKVSKRSKRSRRQRKPQDPRAREEAMLAQFSDMGIAVSNVGG